MRAGIAFVVVSLLVGGGFREWRRAHEARFQDLVAALEGEEATRLERDVGESGRDSSEAPSGVSVKEAGAARSVPVGMLDPDRATAEQLMRLPGIGPKLAARIIADRDAHGPFRSKEALLRVPGIGPRTLERIEGYLRFGAAAEGGIAEP